MRPLSGFAPHDHTACRRAALAAAERRCRSAGLHLTPVRRRALEILLESHAALGAYDVLERLKADRLGSAPPAAYRALEFLVRHGFAHRIERRNAYIACARPGSTHDPAFLICTGCGRVAEAVPDATALGPSAASAGFRIARTTVEAEGLCPSCQAAP